MSTYITGRKLVSAGASLAFVALLAGPALAEPDAAATIESRLEQYEGRFNEGDAEALSKLFSEDVVYYGPLGLVFEGRAAVRQHYQDNMTAGFSDMTVEAIEIKILDDTAYDVARYTITGPNGQVFEGGLSPGDPREGGRRMDRPADPGQRRHAEAAGRVGRRIHGR